MNERVMQFRIGMFVIVAGLVLTMLIVWFGESPALLRDNTYVTVHFVEAPGVAEGIPVRKSGIRVGEVTAIRFDDRARTRATVRAITPATVEVDVAGRGPGFVPVGQFGDTVPAAGTPVDVLVNGVDPATGTLALALPDGVLVTVSLERKYHIRAGATPRISRALIGDVSIDLLPGTGQQPIPSSKDPARAPVIEGVVAPDPSNALAAATKAFERVGGTLESIDFAAKGLTDVTKKAKDLDKFIASWNKMGDHVSTLADDLDRVVKTNEGNIGPMMANMRTAAERFTTTFDAKTQANLRASASQLNASTAKLDKMLTDIAPLAQDLGAPTNAKTPPKTNFGQMLLRMNGVAYDFSLLTRALRGPDGTLNRDGSLQKLILHSELYDNFNHMALNAREVFGLARPLMRNFNRFAERIADDPAAIGRGALSR